MQAHEAADVAERAIVVEHVPFVAEDGDAGVGLVLGPARSRQRKVFQHVLGERQVGDASGGLEEHRITSLSKRERDVDVLVHAADARIEDAAAQQIGADEHAVIFEKIARPACQRVRDGTRIGVRQPMRLLQNTALAVRRFGQAAARHVDARGMHAITP